MKKIDNYFHLYLPFDVEHLGSVVTVIGIVPGNQGYDYATFYHRYGFFTDKFESIKPILRKLDSMTEEEQKELTEIMFTDSIQILENNVGFRWYANPGRLVYLLSKHFDIFNLIESGLAIDASTLK